MMKRRAKKQEELSIEKLQGKVGELEGNWKRALADYRNLEKRVREQQKSFVRLANLSLIDKLLGVLDDLERATVHIKDRGLKLVLDQFKAVLETEGVREIEVEGKEFDPEAMDCIEMVEGPKNKVVKTLLKGYTVNDHVIRPAKVQVGKGK
ncbi:nucleotide exchange factor GrpE [Patescibacteria group bacterium]|nr:nucleotide exchange factor GrpE [Patescibacteria group bacterium]